MADVERHVVTPLSERVFEEMDDARRRVVIEGGEVEPTEAEARNGWTATALTSYLRERLAAQSLWIDPSSLRRRVKPSRQNMAYNPHRWRS